MKKSILLVIALVGIALAAGFWLGRSRAVSDDAAQRAMASSGGSTATPHAHATTALPAANDAPTPRDYANEAAIAESTVGSDAASASAASMPVAPEASKLPPPPPRPASPTENRLLGKYGLRSEDQQNVLMNRNFGRVIDDLSREATADTLEMTRIYRNFVDARMKADPRFQVERMACGAHVCVLSARGPVDQDRTFDNLLGEDAWKDPKNPKFYAVMPGSLPPNGKSPTTEYRLIFTIDPKFNAFEGHW